MRCPYGGSGSLTFSQRPVCGSRVRYTLTRCFSRPAATVARHPARPDVWGLQNLSDEKWVVVRAGAISEVLPAIVAGLPAVL